MTDDPTTLESLASASGVAPDDGLNEALVVAWCRDEPARVGEVLLLPRDEGGARGRRSFVFGRGDGDDGPRPRLHLARQRPGDTRPAEPLKTPHLSRIQLVLSADVDGGLRLENAGKRALLVGDRAVTSARVRPGDRVEIGGQMVLLVTRRPPVLRALRAPGIRVDGAFGEADAFGYVGESPRAWQLRDEVGVVARRREHVLVLGESGAGKEIVAQALHALSDRGARRLVARNASTVPGGILDAELFGNAPSYPNAGMSERPGLVGQAEGSTLYLDEVGELPAELQTHLLRLLDGGDYQRLGDARRRTADVRVIAATNRAVGHLRRDLAARFPIRIQAPGLHERREDIPLLARHLLRAIAAGGAAPSEGPPELSKELTVALVDHLYATHVRELTNVLVRAYLEAPGPVVDFTKGAAAFLAGERGEEAAAGSPVETREVTREAIVGALARHAGVREKVWRELGLANRYVLKRLLKKHGIVEGED